MAPFRSLKLRIALTIFVLECVMMAVVLWQTSGAQTAALRSQQQAAQNALLDLLARVSRTALLTDELNELRFYFETLQRDPAVERVLLANAGGIVVGSADASLLGRPLPAQDAPSAGEWRRVPIENASGRLGELAVQFSTRELLRAQADARKLGLGIAAVGMTAIAFFGLGIGALLTNRLARLGDAARRMAEGDRSVRSAVAGNDEVAALGQAFDSMADAVARQEAQLRAERETTALLLASTAEAIYGVDAQGRCTFVNPACLALVGLSAAADLVGRMPAEVLHGPACAGALADASRNGAAWHGDDAVRRADGSRFAAEVWAHPLLRDGRCIGAVVTFFDVSERKAAEAALLAERNFTAAVLGNAGAIVLVLDREGRIRRFNRAAEQISGWRFDEVEGRRPWDMLLPPEVVDDVRRNAFEALVHQPQRLVGSHSNEWLTRSGQRRWIDWANTLLLDPRGEAEFVVSIGVDVTERRAAERDMRVALNERELLLKEIYHRVKNNLQMVVSLLTLESRNAVSAEVAAALADSASRIKSMALVHEQLYQAGDLSVIDAARYLDQLVHHIAQAQGEAAARVPVRLHAGRLSLGIETAVPLGLMVNELVVNAYKHAFPDGRRGQVQVALTALDDGQVELVVADDGIGLPADFDPALAPSLGMRLVHALAGQLDGEARCGPNPGGGSRFALRFRPELREAQRLPPSPGSAHPVQNTPGVSA